MKKWAIAVLLVALLLELSAFSGFHQFGGSGNIAIGGSSTLVIAKASYSSARVEVSVWPEYAPNGTSLVTLTFLNGTTRPVTSNLDFVVNLPGKFTLGSTFGTGPGYSVSPQTPVNGSIVNSGLLGPFGARGALEVPGLDFFAMQVDGHALIWYRVWAISL